MFEGAKWIGGAAEAAKDKAVDFAPMYRKEFTVKEKPEKAVLSVCAVGYGVVTINGKNVTEDRLTTPLSRYDVTLYAQQYDVTNLVEGGKNAVGAMLGNALFNDNAATWDFEKAPWRAEPQFILKLDLAYAGGKTQSVLSDVSWKLSAEGPVRYNRMRGGEWYDARMEQAHWDEPGFDDAAWKNAVVSRSPGGVIRATAMPPIRIMNTIRGVKIAENTYDFGANIAGWARIRMKAQPGQTVEIIYGEKLHEDGTVDQDNIICYTSSLLKHRDRYVAKGEGAEEWEPSFVWHGFRYAQIVNMPESFEIEARVAHTDLPVAGQFECGDDMLNKIHHAARISTLCNFHSIPTDCPHREQNGWTGDAQLSADQALMNYDMTEAYMKFMQDLIDAQRPSGQLPGIVPTGGWGFNWGSGPAWDSALILIPEAIWRHTGDARPFHLVYDAGMKYLSYMSSMATDDIVSFGLGDWCPPETTVMCPLEITDTSFYYADLRAMATAARLLDKPGDEKRLNDWADRVRSAFRARFVQNGRVVPEGQTAIANCIYRGLLDESEKPAAAKRLHELVRQNGNHLDCGILGMKYIFDSLTDYGYADTAYDLVVNPTRPSYAWWILQGMTSLCEDWELRSSRNHHMFSEVDNWFYTGLAGIRFHGGDIEINPHMLPRVKWVKASSRGVSVEWDKDKLTACLPKPGTLTLNGASRPIPAGETIISLR